MTERMQAGALALDAYERHLFGNLANGHRNIHAEAEGLLHAPVADLIRYGEGNHLDVADLVDARVQARIDRGGVLAISPSGMAQYTVRVPGINDGLHTTAPELEPADSPLLLLTRTAGVSSYARDEHAEVA
ncbi:hypothetical protein [Actinomadura macra]|uniref:hypothetical protein n=1 Tax=Actinomadura macra TaxID=46164 RepID=UPI000833D235|nr:hypothetical protein [Actinomadura macra]